MSHLIYAYSGENYNCEKRRQQVALSTRVQGERQRELGLTQLWSLCGYQGYCDKSWLNRRKVICNEKYLVDVRNSFSLICCFLLLCEFCPSGANKETSLLQSQSSQREVIRAAGRVEKRSDCGTWDRSVPVSHSLSKLVTFIFPEPCFKAQTHINHQNSCCTSEGSGKPLSLTRAMRKRYCILIQMSDQ